MVGESKGYKVFKIINMCIMLFIIAITIIPYLNVVAISLNDSTDTALGGVTIFPRVITLLNYKTLFADKSLWAAFRLTTFTTVIATVYMLTIQFMTAYALKRKDLVGKNYILIFFMIPMFFGGGLIPTYILFAKAKLINNILVYILPAGFSFYNFVIIRTYMNTVAESLEESAKIDGANDWTIFWRIVLPLCKPIIATIALWIMVGEWNDWTTTLNFVTRAKLYSLQFKLNEVLKESERIAKLIQEATITGEDVDYLQTSVTPESIIAAQVIITTVPIICVYPFLQKYFVHGVMIGAVKE
jgi:putative aldouronate transport system permease protein